MNDMPHNPHPDLRRATVSDASGDVHGTKSKGVSQSRVEWVDIAKGIGIFLVVFCHTLRGVMKHEIMPPAWAFVDTWVYAFHMPLFFFLSGLFVEGSLRRSGFGEYVDSKLRRIVWPYFVWSILQEIIRHFSKRTDVSLNGLWHIIYQPVMQFWFLYAIFLILILYGLWRKCGASPLSFVFLAVMLRVIVSLGLPLGSWGVAYEACNYIPFFALGVLTTEKRLLPPLQAVCTSRLLLFSLGGFLLLTASITAFFYGLPLFIIFNAVVGIAATVFLSAALLRSPIHALFKILGIYSMEIYVAHSIFSGAIRPLVIGLGFHSMFVQLTAGILVGLFFPLMLCFLCRRFRIPFVFSFPSRVRVQSTS